MNKQMSVLKWAGTLNLTAKVFGNGISFEYVRFLAHVATGVDTTPELQKLYEYSRSQTTRAITTLERCGMIEIESIKNSRGRRILLTHKAEMFISELHEVLEGAYFPKAESVSQREARINYVT